MKKESISLLQFSSFLILSILLLFSAHADGFYLPDTGQTKCYSNKGTAKSITCPAPGQSLAQDGSYTINPPSYTVNPDGTIFDNNTWLMWQQQDDGIQRTWDDSKAYCEHLTLAGYDDWRLPAKKELASIINYGKTTQAIDTSAFINTKDNYWSSTSRTCYPYYSWYVNFTNGINYWDYCEQKQYYGSYYYHNLPKDNYTKLYARCVRSGPLFLDNFIDNRNSTVTDKSTGLMWQQGEGSQMDWGAALNYCEGLSQGGYSDWRLPNIRELGTIADETRIHPSIDTNVFFYPDIQGTSYCTYEPALYYWSSTPSAVYPDNRLTISFRYSESTSHNKSERGNFVRCVRGQQNQLHDVWEIRAEPQEIDFWYVKPRSAKILPLTVLNVARGYLNIGLIHAPPSPFSVISDGCSGRILSSLTSCSLAIAFSPETEGEFTGSLVIPSNDSDSPSLLIPLHGKANVVGAAYLLPGTGQIICFDAFGYPISCPTPGQPLAQDGSYSMNPQSYTINSEYTVKDNNTGFLWQRQDDGLLRSSGDAATYCKNLILDGLTGWRLPAYKELESINNYGYFNSSPDPSIFPNTKTNNTYWHSDADTSIDNGYVRCLLGDKLPAGVFVDNHNGTVTDLSTGLTWQQTSDESHKNWATAISYCEDLSQGGFSDWRLPNFRELLTLKDSSRYPFININYFPDTGCNDAYVYRGYWSSTSSYSNSSLWDDAYTVAFDRNFIHVGWKRASSYQVRCVRGGNTSLLDNQEVKVSPSSLNFGILDAGSFLSQNLTISNTGTGNLLIGTINGPPSPFSITSDGCSGQTLPASATCNITVKFAPASPGSYSGNISITSNDADKPNVTVSLSGTAVPSKATLTGTVTNASTGMPLSDVSVAVTDSSSTKTTATGSKGTYTITGLNEGNYTAVFSKAGFIIQTVNGTLVAGQTQSLDIQLNPAPALTISINSPSDGAVFNSSPITVTGTVTNDASVTVNGVQATAGSGTFTATIPLNENQNTITASATDQYNQTASQSIAVILKKPPAISNITVNEITRDSAKVSWTTDQPSSTLFEFGTTTTYGHTITDPALTTSYTVTLSGLSPGTTYHFQITSKNTDGLSSSSGDQTFTTLAPEFSAVTIGDYGNVTVMEVTGNYDARKSDGTVNDMPRQFIAKEFYRLHQDVYDFIVIFSNFNFQMPSAHAKAFYLGIKNDIQGIGKPLFDNSPLFGSNSRLQGTIDMGNIPAMIANPADPKFEETIDMLAHEQMHRWAASVKFKDSAGNTSTALLVGEDEHWSYLLDTDGSLMYGNDWKDNGNGTFTSVSASKYYSALDLYLMGFHDKSQVPQMLLIDNSAIDPTKLPEVGATITGAPKFITVPDIIAAEGERVPNASASQKSFKTAFIFITSPGTFTGNELQGIENIRNAWAGRFLALTHGMGSIVDIAPSITLSISSPLEGETINGSDVVVKGSVINTTGKETGVTVNGMPATVYGNQFIANNIPLVEGQNTITVTATDTAGNTATNSISVNAVTTGNYIRIISNIESGIAPLEAVLRIEIPYGYINPTLRATGPVQPEFLNVAPDEATVKMTVEGIYTFTASATGTDGLTYQDSITIIVLNKNQLDTLLKAKWEGMKRALMNQDVEGGLNHFLKSSKESYRQAFNLIIDDLPQLISGMQNIEMIYVKNDLAKYRIRRDQNIDGTLQTYAYYIYFLKDRNGVWKINRF